MGIEFRTIKKITGTGTASYTHRWSYRHLRLLCLDSQFTLLGHSLGEAASLTSDFLYSIDTNYQERMGLGLGGKHTPSGGRGSRLLESAI